ncbi:methionine ABC transporter permease [Mycetocola reblochoni]|uniref:ABC transporter permease n=1 Tax=Mycetocola reblochoni TaxID=331618 RepID=A0A3L6ZTW7_9MICO|nr:methionine ABC transporter permease [Mycetocola reblochoni]RLP71239.1 ABC transporter permease [Mycetocola reblochoni]
MSTATELRSAWSLDGYDWTKTIDNVLAAAGETLYTSAVSFLVIIVAGLVVGIVLYATSPLGVAPTPAVYRGLGVVVNTVRAVPFIILAVAIIPFTKALVGTYIGPTAAIVPIVVSSIPFVARLVETTLLGVGQGKIEAASAMGATRAQIVRRVLLPESVPGIIALGTFAAVAVVGNSAIVGAVGGGGLGNLALTYGYQRFDYIVMTITVVLLVLLVQGLQSLGDHLVARATRAHA